MVVIFKIVMALVAAVSLAAVVHYCFSVAKNPEAVVAISHKSGFGQKLYLGFVLIGGVMIGWAGARFALFWMPASWGGVDESGVFQPLGDTLAGAFGLLWLGLFSYLEASARCTLSLRYLTEQRDVLREKLQNAEQALRLHEKEKH